MALHAGEAKLVTNDYFGCLVACRTCLNHSGGGQVLLQAEAYFILICKRASLRLYVHAQGFDDGEKSLTNFYTDLPQRSPVHSPPVTRQQFTSPSHRLWCAMPETLGYRTALPSLCNTHPGVRENALHCTCRNTRAIVA
jgi:hypothetical protein